MPRSKNNLERVHGRQTEGARETSRATHLEQQANSFDGLKRQATATEQARVTQQESAGLEKPQHKGDRSDSQGNASQLERRRLQKPFEGDRFDPLKHQMQETKMRTGTDRSEERPDRPLRAEDDKTNKLLERVAKDNSRRNILYTLGGAFSEVTRGAGGSLNEQVR